MSNLFSHYQNPVCSESDFAVSRGSLAGCLNTRNIQTTCQEIAREPCGSENLAVLRTLRFSTQLLHGNFEKLQGLGLSKLFGQP